MKNTSAIELKEALQRKVREARGNKTAAEALAELQAQLRESNDPLVKKWRALRMSRRREPMDRR